MNYLSLFSGIGGFELGIQNSENNKKLTCIGYSEVDEIADKIYKKHFPKHSNLGDVRGIKTEDLPSFDLLVGGFPCQAFSNSGNKKGFCDTRGTLFFEIARILQDKKPKYFLLENVRGLLSNDSGHTFKRILQILAEVGYDVEWCLLNSKGFGTAHHRERVFIKGYFRRRCGGEILHNPLFKGCSDSRFVNPNRKEHPSDYLKIRETTKKGYKEAYVYDGVLLNRARRKIAKGIVREAQVGALQTSKIWGVVMPDMRVRYLTPVECERLQGFPDNWTKYDCTGELVSDNRRYKAIGNAVTVPVIKHIFDNWELIE